MQEELKPIGGLNIDGDEKYLKSTEYKFSKNLYRAVNENLNEGTGADLTQGNNQVIVTPPQSNKQFCALLLPHGDNQCIGSFEFEELSEVYIFNWNSNGSHGIYRLNLDAGTCNTVKVDPCFNFDLLHPIAEHNVHLRLIYNTPINGATAIFKELIFNDAFNPQFCVDVETSIATDGYNATTYPYFATQKPHNDSCEFVQLGVRPPYTCIQVTEKEFEEGDESLPNYQLNKTKQFRARYILYDGRISVCGQISTLSYLSGAACSRSGRNAARCFKLALDAGSWMVEKIEILFRDCNGNADLETNPTDWYLYDTIYKYDKANPANQNVKFWERIVTLPEYGANPNPDLSNWWTYTYCGDKQCVPVPIADTSRIYDDLPIVSDALAPAQDKLLSGGNVKFYDNIGNDTLSKIQFRLARLTEDCPIEFVKIVIDFVINNPTVLLNQCVHKDDNVGVVAWGGIGAAISGIANYTATVGTDYGQTFSDEAEGFLVGLRGTPFLTRTRQLKIARDGTILFEGIENSTGTANQARIRQGVSEDQFYVQRAEFLVPKAQYIIEVYDHNTGMSDALLRNSSTYYAGVASTYFPTGAGSNVVIRDSELLVNACNGDVIVSDTFGYPIISDLTEPGGESAAFSGYLTEKDGSIPIELADYRIERNLSGDVYVPPNSDPTYRSIKTDHNGFFWLTIDKSNASAQGFARFYGFQQCTVFQITGFFLDINDTDGVRKVDIQQTSEVGLNLYKDCAHVIIEGTLEDCDGDPIPDVTVIMEHMRPVTTDGNGQYQFRVHAEVSFIGSSGQRDAETILIGQNGFCFFGTCSDCNTCAGTLVGVTPVLNNCAVYFTCTAGAPATVVMGTIPRRYINVNLVGMKSGTTYQMCVIFHDFMKRPCFAQVIDDYYIETAFITDTGGVFVPQTIQWLITATLNLPSWVKYVSFGRTKKKEDALQWVASSVEFVDAQGAETSNVGATYIKIGIDGLLNYNTLNNFRTNTTYTFVEGDRIRFIDDGSGSSAGLYTSAANGGIIDLQVRALENGTTLVVDYDSRLKDLKIGAWIEIYRKTECAPTPIFYEVCGTYAVIDGEIVDTSLTPIPLNIPQNLATFDTYFIYRAIPQKDENGIDSTFITYHPFEHYAPSDFWGRNCQDIGRIFVENKEARQVKRKDEIAFSDTFLSNGLVNGLGTWRSENIKQYSTQDFGGIIAIYATREIIIVICENDWFTAEVNPKYVRVNSAGQLIANPEEFLSDATPKIGSRFGCINPGAIKFKQGLAVWYDEKRSALVVCDYSKAEDVTINFVKSYFAERTTAYKQHNELLHDKFNKVFPVMGYDPKNKYILLTWFTRYNREASELFEDPFINNAREPDFNMGETIVFDLVNGDWITFPAFVPEFYAQGKTGLKQQILFAMKNGQPYTHNDPTVTTFMNFFGVNTDQVIEPVMNQEPTLRKIPLAIDIESNGGIGYFIDRILTGIDGVDSEIPMVRWSQEGTTWHAEVLRSKNSTGGLYKGKALHGYYFRFRLVRDNTLNNSLTEFDNEKREKYNELDHVLVRFVPSERTGK